MWDCVIEERGNEIHMCGHTMKMGQTNRDEKTAAM